MASPDAAGMKELFPQFASHDDDLLDLWIGQAALRFTSSRLGLQWSMAAYLFAAHNLVQFPATSTGDEATARGPVTAESVGDVSRSYGSAVDIARVPSSLQEFLTTVYGQKLIGIVLSRNAARGRVIRTGSSEA